MKPLMQRNDVRLGLAGLALAGAVGLGAFTLGGTEAVRASGPNLSIEVVAPSEPVPEPGSILEVGTLNDGFDRAALDARPAMLDDTYLPENAYVGEDWTQPEPIDMRPVVQQPAPVSVATVTTTDPLSDGSRLFGFDRRPQAVAAPVEPQSANNQSASAKNTEDFFE